MLLPIYICPKCPSVAKGVVVMVSLCHRVQRAVFSNLVGLCSNNHGAVDQEIIINMLFIITHCLEIAEKDFIFSICSGSNGLSVLKT